MNSSMMGAQKIVKWELVEFADMEASRRWGQGKPSYSQMIAFKVVLVLSSLVSLDITSRTPQIFLRQDRDRAERCLHII